MTDHYSSDSRINEQFPENNSDEWRAPPPLPIVRDKSAMTRTLRAELADVGNGEKTCCIVLIRPDKAAGLPDADLMKASGDFLSRCLRPYDDLFALDRDRYLVLLPHIKPEDAATVMDRLRAVVSSEPVPAADGGDVFATASIGGVMMDGAISLQDNMDRAERALDEAARLGGDRIRLWSEELRNQ